MMQRILASLHEVAMEQAAFVSCFHLQIIRGIANASSRPLQVIDFELTTNLRRQDMLLKGDKRLETFNWKRTSDALWESVLKTVAHGT